MSNPRRSSTATPDSLGLLLRDLDRLAHSAARESGKTVAEGRAEVLKAIEVLEFAVGLQDSDVGGAMDVSRGVRCEYLREPLGVTVGITPFNFPAMVPMWMFANAIAAGNTFVLKPSEKDPSASLFLAEVLHEAGVPAGVFNVVHGDKVAVDRILEHPDIAAVSFVGSTPIAPASQHAVRCWWRTRSWRVVRRRTPSGS